MEYRILEKNGSYRTQVKVLLFWDDIDNTGEEDKMPVLYGTIEAARKSIDRHKKKQKDWAVIVEG